MPVDYFDPLFFGDDYRPPESSTVLANEPDESHTIARDATPVASPASNVSVSISTTFHAQLGFTGSLPDTTLMTSDSVLFYVHSLHLKRSSANGFGTLLLKTYSTSIPVQETAALLNVVLHSFYNMGCQKYDPSVEIMLQVLDSLKKYGARLQHIVAPSMPLFNHFVKQAPRQPLGFYIVAASHDLHALAAEVSGYLLSYPLTSITDGEAEKMGPLYYKKLYVLHRSRTETLRTLLFVRPEGHTATVNCSPFDQQRLKRAWELAAAQILWDTQPDLAPSVIQNALSSLASHVSCDICKNSLDKKISQILVQWSMTPRTIE
ncbi:hypothetical protein C8Q75DRAFT_567672 [Abortiporus biennis]|nr:hypothetical protein C8Q75DRAFT_567672 [Abortiporus biennis]